MPRVIPGLVYTNDRCIGCNRCVSVCPIAAANVAVMRKGTLRVEVDGRACIRCGRCITACRHGAREYLDDTDRFFDDLAAGEPIDLIISPTFFALYPDEASRILGYLKTLGVGHFYHADLGAVIAAWCYLGYLDEIGPAQSAGTEPLAHVCPAFTKYIEHQSPDVLARLAPIHTPHMCMAVYLHEYMHVSAKLALLSPCIAAKGEVDSPRTGEIISYSLTYHHLMEHIDRHDLGNRKAICETLPLDTTAIIPPTERLMGNLEWVLPPESMILEIAGLSAAVSNVPATIDNLNSHGVTPVLAELYSCDYACIAGPGAENPRSNPALELMEHCQTRRNSGEVAAMRACRAKNGAESSTNCSPGWTRCCSAVNTRNGSASRRSYPRASSTRSSVRCAKTRPPRVISTAATAVMRHAERWSRQLRTAMTGERIAATTRKTRPSAVIASIS